MNKEEKINKECETCKLKVCPAKCFNRHVGSMIALGKLVNSAEKKTGKKILLLDENGAEVQR